MWLFRKKVVSIPSWFSISWPERINLIAFGTNGYKKNQRDRYVAKYFAVYSCAFAQTLCVLEPKLMHNSVLRSRVPLFFGDGRRGARPMFAFSVMQISFVFRILFLLFFLVSHSAHGMLSEQQVRDVVRVEVITPSEVEDPHFELLSEPGREAAVAMMLAIEASDNDEAMAVLDHADIPEAERTYLLAQYHYELIAYPDCSRTFRAAAESELLSRQLRGRSWLMAYDCAWLDGRRAAASEVVPMALRSNSISSSAAYYLLAQETDFNALLPFMANKANGYWPDAIKQAIRSSLAWREPYHGIVALTFSVDRYGRPIDVTVVRSYPDARAAKFVKGFISGKSLVHDMSGPKGRVLLRVVLTPEAGK
jgi:hypothetical protein